MDYAILDLFRKDLNIILEFLLTCFSICNCWIVLGGGPTGKNESFVGFVGIPVVRSPRISNPENGLVTDGGATGENDLGTNKSCCCCCCCNGGGGAVLSEYSCCCCWGKVGGEFIKLKFAVWEGKLTWWLVNGGAALGKKSSIELFVEVAGWVVVVVVERLLNKSSKG